MTTIDAFTPLFSIIIPAYNRADIVGRAIESCLEQSFERFEIIIVDDGSTDGTATTIQRYDDARISYIRQENAGGAAARNAGAAAARGQYLSFLDSDDAFLPGKLAAFHAVISEASETERNRTVWYSPLRFFRGDGNSLRKPKRAIEPGEKVGDYLFADDGLMQTSTLVMSKVFFDKVRFDNSLKNLQDLDLCLRLEAAGAKFYMLPDEHVVWFDVSDNNRISYTTKADQVLNWAERSRSLMSDKAYSGFMARYLAPRIIRSHPLKASRLMYAAIRTGSVSPVRAHSVVVRAIMPGVYGQVRDALVRLRGRA